MSRTSADRLLQRVASDPGFKLLPEALQLLWFQLLAWSVTAAEKGRVRFPGSVFSSVSRLFCIPETQAETQLQTLESLALLEIDADSNSLWMPGARFSAERAQAAKANGTRGGRPRKGEALEQYRARREREREEDRRQGHLIMAVPGGLPETQETQAEPNAESSRATTTTTSQILTGSGGSTARELSSLGLLETQLATAAGVEPGRLNLEPLQDWLDKGASVALLQRVVAQVASRSTYHPSKVSTWGYFGPAVIQALGELQAVATITTVPSQPVQPAVPLPLDPTCELAGAEAAWVAVHAALQGKLGSTTYRAWISQLALLNLQEGLAVIAAPSAFLRDRVGAEYGVPLRALCQQYLAGCTGYQLVVAASRQQRSA